MTDNEYMSHAIALAQRGLGWTNPNPMGGAVIVKDGRIIGEGWHERHGDLHAERNALKHCTEDPAGATIYVTLEPCCHHGHQPPCTDAIVQAGISRVVVGSGDPNPLVAGKGIEILRQHGIRVDTGVMQDACDAINFVFFDFVQRGRPFVVMKYAMTMDGKIATHTGASQWITGEDARRHVHESRHRYAAIMAGVGTVLADDPMLNCRGIENAHNPIRVICDSRLRIPLASRLVQTAGEIPTIIATLTAAGEKFDALTAAGCQVWQVPERDGHIDLAALMERLGQEKIDSVLLEGGGTLNWSALSSGIVQRVQAYVAPKLFGGNAKSPVEGVGVTVPDGAFMLKNTTVAQVGQDFLMGSEVMH